MELLFRKLGFYHVWENQTTMSKSRLLFSVQKKLEERFIESWKNSIWNDDGNPNGNKLRTYRQIKNNYLNKCTISSVTKVRISNSKLHIEIGRYNKTPLQDRVCQLCKEGVEDEFHFLIQCKVLENERKTFFEKIKDIVPLFYNMSDQQKFKFILESNDSDIGAVCAMGIFDLYNKNIGMKQTLP